MGEQRRPTVTTARISAGPPQPVLLPAKFAAPEVPALTRRRVIDALLPGPDHRLLLICAPAGAGKTTALAGLANTEPVTTTWLQVEHTEATEPALLAHLEHALRRVLPEVPDTPWTDVATAVTSLAALDDPAPVLLLLDDLHELLDTPAESTIERFVDNLPGWLSIVAASRHEPGLNLPRLRVRGVAVDVPSDLLRWRHWEVEQLFRDFYGRPLRPEDAARLTQRTEGWAAGLQLFHLASERLPMHRRRELIDELHTRPGLVRDYLTRNVLANLPAELHRFLVDTCVLGRLDAQLCDRLRGRSDSQGLLADLAHRRLFTLPAEQGRGYRYHEVLRSYLEVSLLERDGAAATRARFARAAELLESTGDLPDALHAYARAEAWGDVHRLLGEDGEELSSARRYLWLGRLPAALMASDPWLQLAEARALRSEGQVEASVAAYKDAEAAFGGAPAATICRDERAALLPWIEDRVRPPQGPTDLLRDALRRGPLRIAEQLARDPSPTAPVAQVLALVLGGDVTRARRQLSSIPALRNDSPAIEAILDLLHLVVDLAGGDPPDPADLYGVADVHEQLGVPWIARLARHLGDLCRGGPDAEIDALLEISEAHGDHWGRLLFALASGIAATWRGRPRNDWLEAAADDSREMGAPVLEAWAGAWAAVAPETAPDEGGSFDLRAARALARQAEVPGAIALLDLVSAHREGDAAAFAAAARPLRDLGLPVPLSSPTTERATDLRTDEPPRPPQAASTPTILGSDEVGSLDRLSEVDPVIPDGAADVAPVLCCDKVVRLEAALTCFGCFRLVHDGREVDLGMLKPQSRQVLGRLALRAGAPVQRETLIDDLWPEGGSRDPARQLRVVISTLRRHLEPDASAGDWTLLERRGEAYVLHPPAPSDVHRFDAAVTAARHAQQQQDAATYHDALRDAFESYAGDLLPELGTPDWLVPERDRYRTLYARVAHGLATANLAEGDLDTAISVAQDGLQVDPYHDGLWRSLHGAYQRSGDLTRAARIADQHAEAMARLHQPVH